MQYGRVFLNKPLKMNKEKSSNDNSLKNTHYQILFSFWPLQSCRIIFLAKIGQKQAWAWYWKHQGCHNIIQNRFITHTLLLPLWELNHPWDTLEESYYNNPNKLEDRFVRHALVPERTKPLVSVRLHKLFWTELLKQSFFSSFQ